MNEKLIMPALKIEEFGLEGIYLLALGLGILVSLTNQNDNKSRIPDMLEGGEEEEKKNENTDSDGDNGDAANGDSYINRLRQRLLWRIGPGLPWARYYFGDGMLWLLDRENYTNNKRRLQLITSHIEWLDEIISLAAAKVAQDVENTLNFIMRYAPLGAFMFFTWRGYFERTSIIERNPMLNNTRYLRYRTLYRRLMSRVAGQSGIPLANIDRIYRTLRWVLNKIRRFRR